MVWPAVIAAGASLASGALGFMGAQSANAANAKQAEANRAFQASQAGLSYEANKMLADDQMGFQRTENATAQHFNQAMMERNQSWSDWQARLQENFQRESMNSAQAYNTQMSNTAWQRGTADMRAAGINPILAVSQGGASSPSVNPQSGSLPSAGMANRPTSAGASGSRPMPAGAQALMQDVMKPAFSNALAGARILSEVENLAATTDNIRAQTNRTRVGAALDEARTLTEAERPDQVRTAISESIRRQHLLDQQTRTEVQRTNTESERAGLTRAETERAGAQASSAHQQSRVLGAEADNLQRWGRANWAGNYATSGEQIVRRLLELFR